MRKGLRKNNDIELITECAMQYIQKENAVCIQKGTSSIAFIIGDDFHHLNFDDVMMEYVHYSELELDADDQEIY